MHYEFTTPDNSLSFLGPPKASALPSLPAYRAKAPKSRQWSFRKSVAEAPRKDSPDLFLPPRSKFCRRTLPPPATPKAVNNSPVGDALVNNLGIFDPKPFGEQIPDEDWHAFFEVNV